MNQENSRYKFRAWSTQTPEHKMIYLGNGGNLADLVESENWKVMQYTGLHDADGRGMWESDIFHCTDFDSKFGPVYMVITWNHVEGCWWLDDRVEGRYFDSMLADRSGRVIGNIHESPELLNNE